MFSRNALTLHFKITHTIAVGMQGRMLNTKNKQNEYGKK